MATQQFDGGVPFAIAARAQKLQLLELPPAVAALLDAPNPPRLSIKSSAASSDRPAYAVLCTPTATFHLRQVQTSNSLFVTQPQQLDSHGNDIPVPATCAIAACPATLELHPSDASAVALLYDALPVYDIVAGEADAMGNGKSKGHIFDNLPLSDAQCQQAWNELMAFEHDEHTYRPSVNALSQVWRSINAAALAEGVKLDSQFLTEDIATAVADDGHPADFTKAVLRHLADDGQAADGPWSCLDRARTVAFVGKTLLEAKQGSSDFLVTDFTDTWEDRLPEAWRKDAKLSAIAESYELPSGSTIRVKSKDAAVASTEDAPAASKPSARKWHEKFAKTRKK
ncbi:sister chromatid cohesion protein-like protein Dcc1 [Boeremia exigua]|uniref:sister chromatid cohesion protein-like protein Dcc1 n=1 Tax=Boeremia exigua TaxID=749465 RepID=UPI001E8DE084|nr:sister chromatid cohesion protein-like protein Dcc1 [Boeremia exigua]KAH6614215.1 sister chromatid cohesion protein-like protein Dcc1 [Boeremia exigua]